MRIYLNILQLLTCTIVVFKSTTLFSQDWKNIEVPVKLIGNFTWQLHPQSDDFNYETSGASKSADFSNKWIDTYHNPWTGPSLTLWKKDHSEVSDGYLKIKASRKRKSKKIHTGCITSKTRIKYPAYIESKVKISNSTLASCVWLLSPDDTQEIDVIEAYGSTDNAKNKWFSERIHLSHHMFIRSPFKDYQPKDAGSWYGEFGSKWHDKWTRVGVYWKTPYHLEYYINGELVREVKGMEIIDPENYSEGKGINKEMDVIINVEDQSWRTIQGLTPTNKELKNKPNNTFLVDWIRIYKPKKIEQIVASKPTSQKTDYIPKTKEETIAATEEQPIRNTILSTSSTYKKSKLKRISKTKINKVNRESQNLKRTIK